MARVFAFGWHQNAKDHEILADFVAMLFGQTNPVPPGSCFMNSNVGQDTSTVNRSNPVSTKGRDFRMEITAAKLGLPVQQQTLCRLLGINKATLNSWEQAGCPKVQIRRDDQADGYVRYDIQAVREWINSFKGTVPRFSAKYTGKPKKATKRKG